MDYQGIGLKIAEEREKKGLSARDLAARLNVSADIIESWENGLNAPPIEYINSMSEIFGISTDLILTSGLEKINGDFQLVNEYIPDERFIKYHYPCDNLVFRDYFSPFKMLSIYQNSKVKDNIYYGTGYKFEKHNKHSFDDLKQIFTKRSYEEGYLEVKKPWIFTRLFVIILILIATAFASGFADIGVILSVILFPLSILLYIFEVNYPRNISVWQVLSIVILGGAMSIFFVYVLREIFGYSRGFMGNLMTGFVEEIAKGVVSFIFIRKIKPKYLLSGILIGAAVGTGFSIIETYMYVFEYFNLEDMNKVILALFRGLLSIGGGHIFWAGITAGALTMMVGNNKAEVRDLFKSNYLKVLSVFILLHAVWNNFGSLVVSIIICGIGIKMIRKQISTGIVQYDLSLRLNHSIEYEESVLQ